MGLLLLIAFISVPLVEIGLFIQVGGFIGLWPTIGVVILTAMAGTALLRHQGLGALARLQDSLNHGEAPLDPVFDGFCLLAAGLLLLTPGFFTDALGFLLFVPPFRALIRRAIASRVQIHNPEEFHWKAGSHPHATPEDGDIIDGDFEDITDPDPIPPKSQLKDRHDP